MIPALETAITALDSLNKADIALIKTYATPPYLVKKLMDSVQLLLGNPKPINWESAKKMLADPQFLYRLVNIDKDNLPEKVSAIIVRERTAWLKDV